MLLKLWENYKASPALKNKQAYSKQMPDELKGPEKWKGGPYNRNWRGKGRGAGVGGGRRPNEPKTPTLPKIKTKTKKSATKGKATNNKTPQSSKKNKSATIIDINPINLDANFVTLDSLQDEELLIIDDPNTTPSKKKVMKEQNDRDQLIEGFNEYYGLVPPPYIIIHPITRTVLDEVRPKYIIAYDSDLAFTRQIEVYKAENPGSPLRVYWMYYEDSVESQKFEVAADRENKAFERLIREKSIMVIGENQDGKQETPQVSYPHQIVVAGNSRRGGRAVVTTVKKKVAVDMREFRSALPCVLHSRGYEIHPITLSVGDYLLTPTVCVERKSITDLFQSLNSGHLYQQTEAMCRVYQNPVLLIEFDADKAFSLQHINEITQDISATSITSKLVLLTSHFPRLRLFWCRNPHATSDLFEDVKENQDDPDPQKANAEAGTHTEANMAIDILRKMPGINEANYKNVIEKVENLYELSLMSLDDLTQLLGGKVHAQKLFYFFHHTI